MRLARVRRAGRVGIAVESGGVARARFDLSTTDPGELLRGGGRAALRHLADDVTTNGEVVEPEQLEFLPPIPHPRKIVCVGLNYRDHAEETGFIPPDFPTLFARFETSLVGHLQAIRSTELSDQLDYEGEMAAVMGETVQGVDEADALEAVWAYSVFNDASVRDFQMKTPQWTAGKNFDQTGAFGPWLVTADELPPGGRGLQIKTRLNDELVQSSSTSNLIFDVPCLVSMLSSFMTLEAGDVIVTGTPSGVGMSRNPPLWMCRGDVCEVEIEGIGVLRNPIV